MTQFHGINIPDYESMLNSFGKMTQYSTVFRGSKPGRYINRIASLKTVQNYVNIFINQLLLFSSFQTKLSQKEVYSIQFIQFPHPKILQK